jgi:Fe-S-cluster containining protein
MVNAFSFACSACGKCCNTPPAMTLAELFRHRDRFIGCIAIGRVPRKRVGERVRVGQHESVLDDADIAAFDAIEQTLLHRAGDTFSITTQGYDYPSLARCPALEDDGRCAIHLHGKPITCEVVPLDPLVPDTLQHLVLAARNQSAVYLGADCIHEGEREGSALMVAQGCVVDANANDALTRRRLALAKEREVWGQAVFNALRKELFDSPAALARIPAGGFLTISIVPALLGVASASENCRSLCVDYIDSQLALIDRCIAQALLRRRLDDRPVTQELRGFANAYRHAKAVLSGPAAAISQHVSGNVDLPTTANAVEAYLNGALH